MCMSEGHTPIDSLLSYLLWLIISIVMLVYLTAAIRQIHSYRRWSRWRIFSFMCGCVLLAIGLTPKLMELAHYDIRVHMAQHLLIGMFAPLALVLAAPLSLALHVLPTQAARRIMQVLSNPIIRFISHPMSALLLNIGGMYVLYLTPLYKASLTYPYLHHLLHLHFLLAGYLFCWAIAGPDLAPRRPGMRLRLAVLFLSMATHAYLSKIMYAYHLPKNTPHTSGQIQEAAKLMYYGGDLAEVLLAVAFFAAWFRISRVRIKTNKEVRLC
ncbi:cytochrome c oxidase assembly protein [Catalinimonas niigatensis]|uniref:cytochrome c oxidase assembly protein n=1 Tax=Catalinimonas niigatensis TaxID=1397264 RepID=UPI002666646E|nr:cytochrome c oxidase assembly protein [Catalinimonas niigatensis]WPP50323.1 cytochrome c oxidase assembly protein [Catalinimonas niigatensis]